MPTALTYTYVTEADIQALLSQDGETGRLDDDGSNALSATESGYLTKAIQWASAKVNFYLLGQYEAGDLYGSWLVNEWATILACYWLSCRRGNPAPGSLKDLYNEALEDLKLVKSGEHHLPDVGLRNVAWPAWSNVRVDVLYALRKIRVERPISEDTPVPYRQNRDVGADYLVEPN